MTHIRLKPLGWLKSFSIYIPAALLMWTLTQYLIPWLSRTTGQETILFWFIVGGLGIFTPLLFTAYLILRSEGLVLSKSVWTGRLRFCNLKKRDLLWSFAGLLTVGTLSSLAMKLLIEIWGDFDHSPPFMSFEPLSEGRYWLLFVWLPYWILNILGEEILWRGVMLPRQEVAFGKQAWLVHGFGWMFFHIAFGWQLLITLIPLIFIQSWMVQHTKNSWTGVILHGGLNGPSFIAISLGWL